MVARHRETKYHNSAKLRDDCFRPYEGESSVVVLSSIVATAFVRLVLLCASLQVAMVVTCAFVCLFGYAGSRGIYVFLSFLLV